MIIRRFFLTLQHYWWLIAIAVLVGWSISAFISYTTVPIYRATVSFIVYPNANISSSRDVVSSLDTLDKQSVISTYADLLASNRVFQETVRKLKLKPADVENYKQLSIVQSEAKILELAVEGPDPRLAALLANNAGQSGINFIKSIYQVYDISMLDQATVPTDPISPRPLQDGGIAAGIGLLAGIFLALISESLRAPLGALRERALQDKESAAYNRRHFDRLLDQEIARNPEGPTSLGLIHLDGLQDLVGVLPASIMSNLLQQVTGILRRMLRGNDVVGRWDKKYTFALLLPSTPGEPAAHTLERIRQALTEPLLVDITREPIKLLPRAGLACLTEAGTSETLIQNALDALDESRSKEHSTVLYSKEKEG